MVFVSRSASKATLALKDGVNDRRFLVMVLPW